MSWISRFLKPKLSTDSAIRLLEDSSFERREQAAVYLGMLARTGQPAREALRPLVSAYRQHYVFFHESAVSCDSTAVAAAIMFTVGAKKMLLNWGQADAPAIEQKLTAFLNHADATVRHDAQKYLDSLGLLK